MDISIGIPTCNRPRFIVEALISCYKQSILPKEIIIGDDSSNRETELLINEFVCENQSSIKIIYFKNNPSLGQGKNVNKIIQHVNYDKFLLLHDDDRLEWNSLETLGNELENADGVSVVYGKQYVIRENGNIDHYKTKKLNVDTKRNVHQLTPLDAAIVQQFPNNSFLIRTLCFETIKYYDERREVLVGNAIDFDFGMRLALAGSKFRFLDVYTSSYRHTSNSISNNLANNAAYTAFKIIATLPLSIGTKQYREQRLKNLAPAAFIQALRSNRYDHAKSIFFCKWHSCQIFTLGGLKRLLYLLIFFLRNGFTSSDP